MRTMFNIHNWISVDWENGLLTPLIDYSRKLHFFQADEEECRRCPIKIRISASLPPENLRKTLIPSAERFSVGDGIFGVSHQCGRRRWKSWVAGLDTDQVSIYYSFPFFHRLEGTTSMFPDYLIAMDVLQPVLEYKLLELSGIVIHACAYAKDGKAVILAGRGGARKSTIMMNKIRAGADFLADDLLIVKDGKVWSYPTTDLYFDYFFQHEIDETVNLKSMIGAFFHIARRRPIKFPVADSAVPAQIGLLIASHNQEYTIIEKGTTDTAFLHRLMANDKLEALDCGDEEESRGRFRFHFNQVFGNNAWEKHWNSYFRILRDNLNEIPYTVIQTGKNFTESVFRDFIA